MTDTLLPAETATQTPMSDLPEPTATRFRPLRAGILNVWQYDEQELWFREGRLLLRGENGSGKTKALELLLPFVLDADLSPARLDPFAGTARTMRWNLLENSHDSRLGYVWLELGRLDDGDPVYATIGAGLRATKGGSGVDSWYFAAEQQRVGHDLRLVDDTRHPIGRRELREQIRGHVFEKATDYRRHLDTLLFGLGDDRFAALRHLMLQLRRPHLSEKLDPAQLSQLLCDSLPPLDTDLIGELSEGFERLDRDKEELLRIERSAQAVTRFAASYGTYCKGIARVTAGLLRGAESAYHKAAAEAREAEAQLARAAEEVGRLGAEMDATEKERHATAGRIRALERSEAYTAARDLHDKRTRVSELERYDETARADAADAREARERDETELGAATQAEEEAREAVALAAGEAGLAAAGCGLASVHAAVSERLDTDPSPPNVDTAVATVSAAVEQRIASLGELRRLDAELTRLQVRFEEAEARRADAEVALDEAGTRAEAAQEELARSSAELCADILAWAEECGELPVPEATAGTLVNAVAAVSDDGADVPDLRVLLASVEAAARTALTEERTRLAGRQADVKAELAETEAERDRLAAASELGPPQPHTRSADRTGRAGAPFYRTVDFRPDLDAGVRAGLEAALESAGILDAWISPSGTLEDAHGDTILDVPDHALRLDGPTLADVLVIDDSVVDDAAPTRRVLAAVALVTGDQAAIPGEQHWVSTDGSWRLGPLRGHWSKTTAEHIGAAARDAARRRRLGELESRVEELGASVARLERDVATATDRIAQIDSDVAQLPSTKEISATRQRAVAAAERVADRRVALAETQALVARARTDVETARRSLHRRATDLGLAHALDDMEAERDRIEHYRNKAGTLTDRYRRLHDTSRHRVAAARRHEASATRATKLAGRARQSGVELARARAELETLATTVGLEAEEVMRLHAEASATLASHDDTLTRLRETHVEARETRATAQEHLRHTRDAQTDTDTRRRDAAERLAAVAATGILSLVIPDDSDDKVEEAPDADPTHTRLVDIARRVESATSDVDVSDTALDRRATQLHERYSDLRMDLEPDCHVLLEQQADVTIVSVLHNNERHDIPSIGAVLRADADTRRGLLEDNERDLLRKFLLGEVGGHLRHRLREANALVQRMNHQLDTCATASGLRLRLRWHTSEQAAENIRDVIGLLQHDVDHLSDDDQGTVARFLQERIALARETHDAVPWADHLVQALDYRHWHTFTIQIQTPETKEWQNLTKHAHGTQSGGEKAVALHLPLFAAAAAHYESARPTAPRLVMLDEAFAGIDQGMKGRCMGLLVAFDLDFMMTSHDEWGFYAELPGICTYQLYRNPQLGSGVQAIRFEWNGRDFTEYDPDTGRVTAGAP